MSYPSFWYLWLQWKIQFCESGRRSNWNFHLKQSLEPVLLSEFNWIWSRFLSERKCWIDRPSGICPNFISTDNNSKRHRRDVNQIEFCEVGCRNGPYGLIGRTWAILEPFTDSVDQHWSNNFVVGAHVVFCFQINWCSEQYLRVKNNDWPATSSNSPWSNRRDRSSQCTHFISLSNTNPNLLVLEQRNRGLLTDIGSRPGNGEGNLCIRFVGIDADAAWLLKQMTILRSNSRQPRRGGGFAYPIIEPSGQGLT